MAKKTIKDIVIDNEELLKSMKTHTELRNWAISKDFDNRSAFPKFKLALNAIGLDYDGIKTGINKANTEQLESDITYSVTMYCDAKASAGKFGITDEDGNVLWYGRFFDDDDASEQSRAELAAAKKAVWLASKVKEAVGAKAIEFNLIIDAQWLTYQDHSGQKGYALTVLARKYNIKLNVEWISGKRNPADKWTTENGYKKWSDNDLKSLAKPIETKTSEVNTPPESDFESKSQSLNESVVENEDSNIVPNTNGFSINQDNNDFHYEITFADKTTFDARRGVDSKQAMVDAIKYKLEEMKGNKSNVSEPNDINESEDEFKIGDTFWLYFMLGTDMKGIKVKLLKDGYVLPLAKNGEPTPIEDYGNYILSNKELSEEDAFKRYIEGKEEETKFIAPNTVANKEDSSRVLDEITNMFKNGLKNENVTKFNNILKSIKPSDAQFFTFAIFDGGKPINVRWDITENGSIPVFFYPIANFGEVSAMSGTDLTDSEERELYKRIEKGSVQFEKIPKEKYANAGMKREVLISITPKFRESDKVNIKSKLKTLSSLLVQGEHDKTWYMDYTSKLPNANQTKLVDSIIRASENGELLNKSKLEKMAESNGIQDKNLAKELAELSVVLMARNIIHETR